MQPRSDIAGLELCHGRAGPADTADDLMAWDARIDRGHHILPFVPHLVKIGMTDPAEEDLDLDVVFIWIAPRDGRRDKRRCRTGGGVGLRFIHEFMILGYGLAYSMHLDGARDRCNPLS
jgi:hypothetical protein